MGVCRRAAAARRRINAALASRLRDYPNHLSGRDLMPRKLQAKQRDAREKHSAAAAAAASNPPAGRSLRTRSPRATDEASLRATTKKGGGKNRAQKEEAGEEI